MSSRSLLFVIPTLLFVIPSAARDPHLDVVKCRSLAALGMTFYSA
jgi:hypothetical protein